MDEFCLEDFTKLWPGDLAFLEEFECVIADILLDGIISGDIELPEFLLVVKVLKLDIKKFLMPWQLKIKGIKNNKQPRNDDHFDRIANISVDSATLALISKMDSICNSLSGIQNSIDSLMRT